MPVQYKLGKKPAVHDHRVPRMSVALPGLPKPPANANWYASVHSWPMLGNDQWGDCVEAAVLHAIQQMSGYAMHLQMPTQAEAEAFYEQATGFNPADPSTDQGTYMLGTGGAMEFWINSGVTCGGKLNKVQAFLQIVQKNPVEWMQGVHYFGGMLTGLQLPEVIVSGSSVPFVWSDFSGPVAGGHEIWINGYETVGSERVYDLVSWGQMFRATEPFLMNCVDEAVVVIDPVEINARGTNAAGVDIAQLTTDMSLLRKAA